MLKRADAVPDYGRYFPRDRINVTHLPESRIRTTNLTHTEALEREYRPRKMKILRHYQRTRQPSIPHEGACVTRSRPSVVSRMINHDATRRNATTHKIAAHRLCFVGTRRINATAHKNEFALPLFVALESSVKSCRQPRRRTTIGIYRVSQHDGDVCRARQGIQTHRNQHQAQKQPEINDDL